MVIRKWLKVACILVFVWGVIIPILIFLVTNTYDLDGNRKVGSLEKGMRSFEVSPHERKPLDYSDVQGSRGDIEYQIKELQQIATSVRNELRNLERERTRLHKEVDSTRTSLSRTKKDLTSTKSELQGIRGKLAKSVREMKRAGEYADTRTSSPVVVINLPREGSRPHQVIQDDSPPLIRNNDELKPRCFDESCFDYSKCPLTRPFGVYVYTGNDRHSFLDLKLVKDLTSRLRQQHSLVDDPDQACIFIAAIGGSLGVGVDAESLQKQIKSLPHYGDGSNHVIMHLGRYNDPPDTRLRGMALGRGIGVKGYSCNILSEGFNILIPPVTRYDVANEPLWQGIPPFLPPVRKFFLLFEGAQEEEKRAQAKLDKGLHFSSPFGTDPGWISETILMSFQKAIVSQTSDSVVMNTQCWGTGGGGDGGGGGGIANHEKPRNETHSPPNNLFGEWTLCGTAQQRALNLSRATFSLVIGSRSGYIGPSTYTRLIEALHYGAIPVIIGIRHLPLENVIDWNQAAVILHSPDQLGELHYILRKMNTDSLLRYRRQGRFLWDTYFSSPSRIIDSVVAVLRHRASHPPPGAPEYKAMVTLVSLPGENRRIPSPRFQYNHSSWYGGVWNSPPGPFRMYPLTPFKPVPISGSQYVNLDSKQVSRLPRHVIAADGISGPYFEDYLLGNVPEEQFTVVILTFERDQVLVGALDRLRDLDHLAKVVVVWNNPNPPSESIKWPDIGVAIDVVSVGVNSLNNRFLPFSNIDTEAVLSLDDDVHLRHDEIQFGFRVWRESRDRIVGFPGRFHAWDTRHSGWLYNSNYTCELSMVLTGAAFIHKYYMYLYSQWMHPEVREMVDKYINCEDIAMNFLVSHITRKPPLKVTSRWTFRCVGCPETLSSSDEHFNERHVCMNKLVEIFGYMPLLYTQFRLDSVLFKTRLPSHLEKCYEFI